MKEQWLRENNEENGQEKLTLELLRTLTDESRTEFSKYPRAFEGMIKKRTKISREEITEGNIVGEKGEINQWEAKK